MGFTSQFREGIAGKLAAGDVAPFDSRFVYTGLGIWFNTMPTRPDRALLLTVYNDGDDPTQAESEISFQIRVRGTKDTRTVDDVQDAAFALLQNLPRQQLNGITIAACWRTSTAYLGVDGNGRHESTSNWRARVHRPTTNRT